MLRLTEKEKAALRGHWNMPIRTKAGNVEACKRGEWGILCSTEEGKKNAQMIIEKEKR